MAKKKREEHHGGAWKVAYADFVTAMMALFMVLWISAQDNEILIATSRYFQDPFNAPMDNSTGVLDLGSSAPSQIKDSEESSLSDLAFLNKLAREFYRQLDIDEAEADNPVEVRVTSDGLRVVIFDRHDRPLFVTGKAEFTEWGGFVMQNLAWLIDRRQFKVRVDGHTAAGFDSGSRDYTGWELSADRANAARRVLEYYAVDAAKIERVTGFGDTVPLAGRAPDAPENQRIELSLIIAGPLQTTKR